MQEELHRCHFDGSRQEVVAVPQLDDQNAGGYPKICKTRSKHCLLPDSGFPRNL
jgi:hypothetical protein